MAREASRRLPNGCERGVRRGSEAVGFGARFLEAENRGIGGLRRARVFAGGLAELFGRLRDIENVVDDLKGETERLAETR